VAGVVGMVELRGRLADGLEVLATDASDREPVLAVMEVGAEASDGTPVAGRRVAVGFGGTQFDPRQLNATAETLIQRSLQWAASGGGRRDDGLVAHWRFDERGGLVANDSGKHNLDASLVDMDPGDTWRPGH